MTKIRYYPTHIFIFYFLTRKHQLRARAYPCLKFEIVHSFSVEGWGKPKGFLLFVVPSQSEAQTKIVQLHALIRRAFDIFLLAMAKTWMPRFLLFATIFMPGHIEQQLHITLVYTRVVYKSWLWMQSPKQQSNLLRMEREY